MLAEHALLRQQLLVLRLQVARPPLSPLDRVRLVLRAAGTSGWKQTLLLVHPETRLRWQWEGIRFVWTTRAGRAPGTARIAEETIALIRQRAAEHPLWGAERILWGMAQVGAAERTAEGYPSEWTIVTLAIVGRLHHNSGSLPDASHVALSRADGGSSQHSRLWAAEARVAGRGGIAAVVRATGMAENTIRRGLQELEAGERLDAGQVRRPGAGRKALTTVDPTLLTELERLVDAESRGDPESPLR